MGLTPSIKLVQRELAEVAGMGICDACGEKKEVMTLPVKH